MPDQQWTFLNRNLKAVILGVFLITLTGLACKPSGNKEGNSADEPVANAGSKQDSANSSDGSQSENNAFNYQPEKPVDGKLKGVVEVGASGFNSFVVSIDPQKRWEVVSQDFGQSLVYEGLATANDISTGLEKYISSMASKGVDRRDMHFLISSGAQKEPKTKDIAAELKKMGLGVILVTAKQEGEWGLRCILPDSFSGKSFVTDIGSGNTKLAWIKGSGIEVLEAPGSKYYEKDMQHEAVYTTIKEKSSNIPTANREVCFIMGGTPFDLAKQHRNGEERYTVLKNPDDYAANKPKTKAGLNIYKAIKDATGCETFVFDWYGNFTIGYLLQLPE